MASSGWKSRKPGERAVGSENAPIPFRRGHPNTHADSGTHSGAELAKCGNGRLGV